jgi:hypothetical protein
VVQRILMPQNKNQTIVVGLSCGCICLAALLFSLLEDLSEVITPQHCLDMIGWLEQHRPLLNSETFISGPAAVNAVRFLLGQLSSVLEAAHVAHEAGGCSSP